MLTGRAFGRRRTFEVLLYRYLLCIYEYSRKSPTSIKLNQVPRNGPEHCISAFPEAETPYNEEEKDLFRNLSPHRRMGMILPGQEAEK